MKEELPLISIVIPCRNEEKFIGKCLDSIIKQQYPKEKLEVLVVDAYSDDKTREIVKDYSENHSFIKLLNNKEKVTPKGMNIGVKASKGEIIILPVNAHSFLDKDFLRWNVYYLNKFTEAKAVGGRLRAINEKGSMSKTITLVSDSIFGSGGIRYRQRDKEGFVKDTLPYCAYRREVFEKNGLVDENLIRGNDAEFNLRLLKNGGKIYFSPKIKSFLYTRPHLKKFSKQQFQYGYFKIRIAQKLGYKSIFRQCMPAVFILFLILTGILGLFFDVFGLLFLTILLIYLFFNIIFSLEIATKNGFKCFFLSVFVFFVLHFSYGLGFLKGFLDFCILKKKENKDIGITR